MLGQITRWSGDVIRRTGMKNFNAVSHNRVRPYFRIQHGRSEVRARRVYLNVHSVTHGMICWVLAMEMLQGVWTQHLRLRAVVGYRVKIFLPSPPNYVTDDDDLFCILPHILERDACERDNPLKVTKSPNDNLCIFCNIYSSTTKYLFGKPSRTSRFFLVKKLYIFLTENITWNINHQGKIVYG